MSKTDFNSETKLSTITIKGHTYTGTDLVFEGFYIQNPHSPTHHAVVHLVELGSASSTGDPVNMLHHPITVTGVQAVDLIADIKAGTALGADHDHDHGFGGG